MHGRAWRERTGPEMGYTDMYVLQLHLVTFVESFVRLIWLCSTWESLRESAVQHDRSLRLMKKLDTYCMDALFTRAEER